MTLPDNPFAIRPRPALEFEEVERVVVVKRRRVTAESHTQWQRWQAAERKARRQLELIYALNACFDGRDWHEGLADLYGWPQERHPDFSRPPAPLTPRAWVPRKWWLRVSSHAPHHRQLGNRYRRAYHPDLSEFDLLTAYATLRQLHLPVTFSNARRWLSWSGLQGAFGRIPSGSEHYYHAAFLTHLRVTGGEA